MRLADVNKGIATEMASIKQNPGLLILRLIACISLFVSVTIFLDPFLGFTKNILSKLGMIGFSFLLLGIAIRTICPPNISSIFTGEIITKVDSKEDMKIIALFYFFTVPCSYLLMKFSKLIHHESKHLEIFYDNTK